MSFTKTEEEFIEKTVGKFCEELTPKNTKQVWVEYKIDKQNVIIVEKRPYWNQNDPERKDIVTELAFAKVTFLRTDNKWILYWKRANEKWERYKRGIYTGKLEDLLNEIAKDPHGCFFG